MRRLWYNGVVDSMDEKRHRYEALGTEDKRIVFLGTNEEALTLDWDEKRDLHGAQMLPGFQDSHLHLLHYAAFKKDLSLSGVTSIEEVIWRCKEQIDAGHPRFLLAVGWNQEAFEEKRILTRQDLDRISDEIPVCAIRACLHIAVCNSPMIQRIKMLKDIPDWVKKDIDEERGVIRENAARIYMEALPPYTDEEIIQMILDVQKDLHAKGITGVQSDDLRSLAGVEPFRLIRLFRGLEEKDKLEVRIYEQCLIDQENFQKLVETKREMEGKTQMFRIGPRKILQDGSLGAKTAELAEGYFCTPDNHGKANHTCHALYTMIRDAQLAEMDVAVHTIGDLALKKVCDTISRVNQGAPWPGHRHGVVHAQITNPQLLVKMKEQGIQAFIQPIFIDQDMGIIEACVGEKRIKDCYIWKTMIDEGLHISGGSDCPVEPFDVLENIQMAVTRKNRKGTKIFLPDQALSVEEAIRLFTINGAWACRDEQVRGTLEIGKYADMVVLNKNLFDVEPEKIKEVDVLETIVNGKTVYLKKK